MPQVWGCEPASLPIPAGAPIPSPNHPSAPPQLRWLLPKPPSSFSLSGKESTARPRGSRSPTPWPEIPQPCSRACSCLHSADIPGCAGDQWHLGQFLLSCKCRSECFVLLSSLYAEDWLPCRDLERGSSGMDGTLHPGAAAVFSVM